MRVSLCAVGLVCLVSPVTLVGCGSDAGGSNRERSLRLQRERAAARSTIRAPALPGAPRRGAAVPATRASGARGSW